jgi:hypothetical protein
MNKEMWDEAIALIVEQINENDPQTYAGLIEARTIMETVERRHLAERVAEILESADWTKMNRWCRNQIGHFGWCNLVLPAISQALRSGDTSEIEKWRKK